MHELAIESLPLLQADLTVSASTVTVINGPSFKTHSKIIDLIKNRQRIQTNNGRCCRPFYSIEISPATVGWPSATLDYRDFAVTPLFTAVTWSLPPPQSSSSANNAVASSLSPSQFQMQQVPPAIRLARSITCTATLSHISCHRLTESWLNETIFSVDNGAIIENILALRGDVVDGNQQWLHTIDMVMAIRKRYTREELCIGVGGYPQVHPEAESPEADLMRLKQKVDAGADFVITQTCFSASAILQFIAASRDIGIAVPIVPGLFVPSTFRALIRMCAVCSVLVPDDDFRMYKKLRDDAIKFRQFAVERAKEMLRQLFSVAGLVAGVHFFTLNHFDLVREIVADGWFE